MRRIREEYLTGTSCTLMLCGKRRLGESLLIGKSRPRSTQHGLVGIGLPNKPVTNAKVRVPNRFFDNCKAGYAAWLTWKGLFVNQKAKPAALGAEIENANAKSKDLINNTHTLMSRNGVSP